MIHVMLIITWLIVEPCYISRQKTKIQLVKIYSGDPYTRLVYYSHGKSVMNVWYSSHGLNTGQIIDKMSVFLIASKDQTPNCLLFRLIWISGSGIQIVTVCFFSLINGPNGNGQIISIYVFNRMFLRWRFNFYRWTGLFQSCLTLWHGISLLKNVGHTVKNVF